jgi:hypothetical protein
VPDFAVAVAVPTDTTTNDNDNDELIFGFLLLVRSSSVSLRTSQFLWLL